MTRTAAASPVARHTFRACYHNGLVSTLLTAPEHADLPAAELLALARANAAARGLAVCSYALHVGPWYAVR